MSVLSSRLDELHCKYGQEKNGGRQRVAAFRWYFVMPLVTMATAERGGSHRRGDAMGIFLSTIPGCEINTEIKFHSPLPTAHRSPGSPTVACKQTQTSTGGARRAEFEALHFFFFFLFGRRGKMEPGEHMHAHVRAMQIDFTHILPAQNWHGHACGGRKPVITSTQPQSAARMGLRVCVCV